MPTCVKRVIGGFAALALALAACGGGAPADPTTSTPGPQQIVGATELRPFDPTTFPGGDGPAVGGACVTSALVPGAYRCELDGGGADEPCFALDGARLVCGPNPVAGSYRTLVSPSAPLPPVQPAPPEEVAAFFVQLRDGPTCAIRTGPEPVIFGGATATFDCDTPYTYLTTLDKSGPTWRAMLSTLDPATGTSSNRLTDVERAWLP